jgi:hypothetical protein
MRSSNSVALRLMIVAFVLVSAGAGNAFANGKMATSNGQPLVRVAPQEKVEKLKGVVVKREQIRSRCQSQTAAPLSRFN